MTRDLAGPSPVRCGWPSVRVSRQERTRVLPGDDRISQAIDALTHGVTIRRAPRDVWPWLLQMGAGSRGGWYSYDWLDNGRQPSAMRIVPELQHPVVGSLAGDGKAVELARKADGKVADVDHLLDLAEALLDDLAGFKRNQPGQRLLGRAQFFADQPYQFTAAGCRDGAPC